MEEQQSNDLKDIINSKVDVPEKEYRAHPAINYSMLSSLASSPSKVHAIRDATDSMILGSIVDNLLTKGSYGDEYAIMSVEKPTGQLGTYCDHYYHFSLEGSDNPHSDAFIATGSKGKKPETMMKDFMEKGGLAYVAMMREATDKTLVPMSIISKATDTYNRLKESKFVDDLLNNKEEHIEVMYQVPIIFELPEGKGEGKALFDILVIDHKQETIIPIDLKTTFDSSVMFRASFMKWKYYLQASYYHYGLSSISKYEVLSFFFLTISTTINEPPVLWKCSAQDLMVGRSGLMRPNSNSRVKGWEELLGELKWHTDNDSWELPREFYDEEPVLINMFDRWQ